MYKLAVALFFYTSAHAQIQDDTLVHLKDAVLLGQDRAPLLISIKYESDAAVQNINVAKYNTRVPTIDATYQAGLSTANNLTGIFYPYGILPMSGPPSSGNNYSPATGSAASILLNWQAVTFGQKEAQINVSTAEANSKKSELEQALFQHKINIISAYLDLLLAYDVVAIHTHNLERVQANLKQSRVLSNTGIKPGVDTALFLSELSKASVDLLNAQKQLQVYQLLLQQLIVTKNLPVPVDTAFLGQLPVAGISNDTSFSNVPVIKLGQSQVLLSESKERLLKKSYLPKLSVWGTGFARGSGFQSGNNSDDIKTWDGLQLSRFNYGAGVQLAFPIMKYGEVKRQLQQQQFITKAAKEKIEDSKLALTTQQNIANTTFNSSLAIATQTQQQLKTGQYAFKAMQTRYNTGLANFPDLIQAQYNLLKAELDVKTSYWDAWKALLLQAVVKGDEHIFLNEIK
ncbi:outer membrane efflux protein [Niastella koreensis GR20-10]|uniref:Outer membrane efflux protein n=2 Tax=Niastella koreensis TaxID=354356 RepID=G8TRG3_NIAKG|nr:TolC family protein [Niastella koreensis]AEW01094.1 outer membrane efflux protein [Niastella koreensis GR20-10]